MAREPMRPSASPPPTADVAGVALLRQALEHNGFDASQVQEALATEVSASREVAELPLYDRLLGRDELGTLIRLFLLGLPVSRGEAERALHPLPLERANALGLVGAAGDECVGAIEIVPADDLLIACDSFRRELERRDHVLGVSPPAKVLARLTVRLRVGRALDLGTGNGLQAVLAARHANRVVGTDLNGRALGFARFNAVLNGIDNLELREGDLFEPVAGEVFDLVVCNPPYVISPESGLLYRDGGELSDALCEAIVRRLPDQLAEGGFGHVLVSWVHGAAEDWTAPLRRWVEGSGCDALLLRYTTHDPLSYAAGWNQPFKRDARVYGEALDRWAAYFERAGIEAISWGALVLRKRRGQNWVFAYEPPSQRMGAAGLHVLRMFEAHDYLDAVLPEQMLGHRLRLVDTAEVVRTGPVGSPAERLLLRLTDGLRPEVGLDPSGLRMLEALDGRTTLAEAIAESCGDGNDELAAAAVRVARRLVALGYLDPVDEG
jgi:methylase of polypeptide subunit release factors